MEKEVAIMAAHVKDIRPLMRLLEQHGFVQEEAMTAHVKDIGPLARILTEHGHTLAPCGIREPGQLASGFCQALWGRHGTPAEHTAFLIEELRAAGARCANSHELFLGHKPAGMSTEEFVARAVTPFRGGNGCAPILITGLDARSPEVDAIFSASQPLAEPMLVRIIVGDESAEATTALVRRCVAAVEAGVFPKWWPLLQGDVDFGLAGWEHLRKLLGECWAHVCIALSPFTPDDVFQFTREQIVVAQHIIGDEVGIGDEDVTLFDAMCTGRDAVACGDARSYAVHPHIERIRSLGRPLVHILIGPTQADWNPERNRRRVRRALTVLARQGITL